MGWAALDGNPLRRGIDRVERALWIILVLACLAVAPLVVPLAGHVVRTDSVAQARLESSWREVSAVLLRRAPQRLYGYASATVWVSGRWRAPSGATRSGLVPAGAGAPAGSVVRVWVNKTGRLTGTHPLTAGLIGSRVIAVEVLVAVGLAAAAAIFAGLVRWLLNRRRMANWGIEWACFGPRWSSRR